MRVVIDELLLGNYLEEVQCAPRFNDCPLYSFIPEGTTPDDIARCADPDLLDTRCTGANAVCLNPAGMPCGIRDEESPTRPADGAPDDLRMIAGAVIIRCGTVDIGLDDQASFWQPSGNQLVPAGETPEGSLGPAILVRPANSGALPTSQTDCRLVFAPNVVDKDHIRICTPAGGTLDGACTPGDVDGFTFGTEVFKTTSTQPSNGATGVALVTPIRLNLNATVDDASLNRLVTLTENGVRRTDVVVIRSGADKNVIQVGLPDGPDANMDLEPVPLLPDADYEVKAEVKDTFGIAPPAPFTFTFTTGT
jgi:hypothetical protein